MKIFGMSCRTIIRRPFIIIYASLLALAGSLVSYYNPVTPIIYGLSSNGQGKNLESIVSILQLLINPSVIPVVVLALAGASLLFSLMAGILLSGYFHIINNALEGRKKVKKEFSIGIKKYFVRVFLITFRVMIFFILLTIFMLVASVPAIVVTRASGIDGAKLVFTAVLIDILTFSIIFFGLMFFRVYMFFWYPAATGNFKRPFIVAKRVADRSFWKMTGVFLVFDIIYVVSSVIFANIGGSPLIFALKWIYSTIFYTLFVLYIFILFKTYLSEINGKPAKQ